MLQITDNAASVFRIILAQEDVDGSAIRLAEVPADQPGTGGIRYVAVDGPQPGDLEADVTGVQVFVDPRLADRLDDAVLDAESSESGTSFSLHKQGQG